jgi:sodium-independent sulfate anion transporter 11
MDLLARVKLQVRTDENLLFVRAGTVRAARALPRATLEYAVEKVPIVQWLPRYSPRWILNDLVAGLTVGILLVR